MTYTLTTRVVKYGKVQIGEKKICTCFTKFTFAFNAFGSESFV
jgi:hypothetical protein